MGPLNRGDKPFAEWADRFTISADCTSLWIMKHLVVTLVSASLLVGCSSKPTRIEATVSGNTGKYMGFPLCIEVSYENDESLGVYERNVCTSQSLAGAFNVTLTDEADDTEHDTFRQAGNVFLRANAMEIAGTETSRDEEQDGDTQRISVTIDF